MDIFGCTATPNLLLGNSSTRATSATYSQFIGSCSELTGKVTKTRCPSNTIPSRGEVEAFFGGIHAGWQVLEVLISWIGQPHTDRPGDFRPSAPPFNRLFFGESVWHGSFRNKP